MNTAVPKLRVLITCNEQECERVLRIDGRDAAPYVKLQHKHTPNETLLVCAECWEYPDVQEQYTGENGQWKISQP